MIDLLDYDEEQARAKRETLLRDAFGRIDGAQLAALKQWFCDSFGIHLCAFRPDAKGDFNPLHAMQNDAYREVWLRFEQETLLQQHGKEME